MSETNGQPKKYVLLGMPSYGTITAGAAQGFYRASNRPNYQLVLHSLSSSLLAMNFNRLWCRALNESKSGKCDYFAMQHSDIEPEEFWLDKLIDELEAKKLDVLGVVVPLKGTIGTTSTALVRPGAGRWVLNGDKWEMEGETWRPLCRLTMKEVYRLPETFTSDDVGHPIMLNTGLWVCKFRREWAEKVFFTINDRIVIAPNGDYVAENEPEDWFFSKLLHGLNLKIGCTRVVKVGHVGEATFGNSRGWGEKSFDEQYGLKQSVLDGRYPPDWFPEDVDGWLYDKEGRELARLAEGKDVLEIGAYCGKSTICLAQKARSVVAVDPFDSRATPSTGPTLRRFRDNIERYGVADRVTFQVGTSEEIVPDLDQFFDLVYIDGAHDEKSVQTDIALALTVLRPDGLIAFHDYRVREGEGNDGVWNPGVTAAVNEFLSNGATLLHRIDSLAVVRPPATVDALLEV